MVADGQLSTELLWAITTLPERITIALILGLIKKLPTSANTPILVWNAINQQQRGAVSQFEIEGR